MSGKSIAVWTAGGEDPSQTHEIHVNYWRMAGGNSASVMKCPQWLSKISNLSRRSAAGEYDLLELGVWISNPKDLESVSVYLPLKISRSDVYDCSDHFKNADISQAIFNEPVSVTHGQQKSPVITARINDEFYTLIFSFEKSADGQISISELGLKEEGEGVQLTITSKALRAAQGAAADFSKLYFRLRIGLRGGSPFVSTIRPYDTAFLSGHEEIDYIDFRVNETRSLPREVQEELRRSTSKLSKISFLTAAPISLGLSGNDAPLHKVRVLEASVWGNYVEKLPPHMMVYHWRKDWTDGNTISDFSGFAKFAMRRSGRWRVMKYLLIFIVVSAFSSWLAARIDATIGPPSLWLQGASSEITSGS